MTAVVGVRRSLLWDVAVAAACAFGVVLAIALVEAPEHRGLVIRLWVALAFCEFFGVTWLFRSLSRPWWFRIDDEGVTISRFLGRRETLPHRDVDSHLGNVVDVRRNRRFWVGEAKFPGAEKLHRAIRVRRSMAGVI